MAPGGSIVIGNAIRERHHQIEGISAKMSREVNVLYYVERRQQVNETASVWVIIVLSPQVIIFPPTTTGYE